MTGGNLIEVRGLNKTFTVRRGALLRRTAASTRAVADVDLDIRRGEVLGCVGGSGSGKSTLGRLIIRLIEPDSGEVRFDGQDLGALRREELRAFRKRMQIVFQD